MQPSCADRSIPCSADALAEAPRPNDWRDVLAFNPENPEGPHLLTRPPYPGPRRVYLENGVGERITLSEQEVAWQPSNSQEFTLSLKSHRETSGLNQITVFYGISGIFTTIKKLIISRGATSSSNTLLISCEVESEIKASRALQEVVSDNLFNNHAAMLWNGRSFRLSWTERRGKHQRRLWLGPFECASVSSACLTPHHASEG